MIKKCNNEGENIVEDGRRPNIREVEAGALNFIRETGGASLESKSSMYVQDLMHKQASL